MDEKTRIWLGGTHRDFSCTILNLGTRCYITLYILLYVKYCIIFKNKNLIFCVGWVHWLVFT